MNRDDFFLQLFQDHHDLLYSHVLNRCKKYDHPVATADDLMQDFYLKVLTHTEQIRLQYEIWNIAYLFTTLNNLLTDYHRSKQRRFALYESQAYGKSDRYEMDDIKQDDFLSNVLTTNQLSLLSYPERSLLHSRYKKEMTYEQIADFHRMPIGTVANRLKRALDKLRKQAGTHRSDS
ncbi:MAG: RNA polymerase sigma factor [Bacteroidota bacterium]